MQLALDTEEPFYFVPHVAKPLGPIALAPIRVNDATSWHAPAASVEASSSPGAPQAIAS